METTEEKSSIVEKLQGNYLTFFISSHILMTSPSPTSFSSKDYHSITNSSSQSLYPLELLLKLAENYLPPP